MANKLNIIYPGSKKEPIRIGSTSPLVMSWCSRWYTRRIAKRNALGPGAVLKRLSSTQWISHWKSWWWFGYLGAQTAEVIGSSESHGRGYSGPARAASRPFASEPWSPSTTRRKWWRRPQLRRRSGRHRRGRQAPIQFKLLTKIYGTTCQKDGAPAHHAASNPQWCQRPD